MLDAKRVFVSLGTGLFMSISLIAIMLTSKILNGPEWISMVILWIFFWPIWLFVYVIPAPGRVGAAVTRAFYRPYNRHCDFFCANLRGTIVVKA
jgi:hypothetical protein